MPTLSEPDIFKLPKPLYNALRSFVNSSLKQHYEWNQGLLIHDRAVWYKFGERGLKWQLTVSDARTSEEMQQGIGFIPQKLLITLIAGNGSSIEYITWDNIMQINGDTIQAASSRIVFEPEQDVPFSEPIPAFLVISRMLQYANAYLTYMQNMQKVKV